ncbi:type II secretion system F family protein [uncultured Ruminobacter sp.]|jgi:MSHA biogenesis protein MshG|uniref:type II secretion system F family protein n=1 Tax=uncultured Ruminobacter sp. TaxID=538947 RepID=UPI002636A9A2|nr:type II secretion system F family protein [uncultured Ruminobacter sp.]
MPTYKYKAKNFSGGYVTGTIEANSLSDVIDEVTRTGMIPVDILETKQTVAIKMPPVFSKFFKKKVKTEQLVMFCRQMYSLSKAGVPMIRAINGLSDSMEHPALKESLMKLNRDLIGGKSLALSMSEQPDIYNSLFVAMINVGENTGKLDDVFAQLATYFELDMQTKKSITAAMRYPIMVMLFIVAAVVILNIFVIPVFTDMFSKFGVDLPITTRILITTSNIFVNYWPYMLAVAIAVPLFIKNAMKKESVRTKWDQYKLKIPVIGNILNMSLLGRFCRSFSLMLQSGVPLNTALRLVADALDNKFLEKKVLNMQKQIEQGVSLSQTALQSQMFSPLVLQMFAVGDETGRVDELLIEGADYYEREVDYGVKSLTSKIEPLLLVVVSLIVGLLAMGIFSPMWDMYGAMQGKQ